MNLDIREAYMTEAETSIISMRMIICEAQASKIPIRLIYCQSHDHARQLSDGQCRLCAQ
jgi:hypothetical protein